MLSALNLRLAGLRRRLRLLLSRLLRTRSQDGVQGVAFLSRPELDNTALANIFDQPFQNLPPQPGARHLASAKKNRRLDLIAFIQKTQHVVFLGLVVVIVHVNAELHFLDRDRLLVLLGFAFLFFLLIEKLPIVHDAANRRLRGGGNLYQVQILFAGHLERFMRRHDADLLALIANHADFACTDALVCADKTLVDTNLRLFSTAWDEEL